jgi:hypothetical protein
MEEILGRFRRDWVLTGPLTLRLILQSAMALQARLFETENRSHSGGTESRERSTAKSPKLNNYQMHPGGVPES